MRGTGEFALLLADFYRLIRSDRETLRRELEAMRQERMATRRQEQGETRRLRERITLADRIVGTYFRRVAKTVDRTLAALGYHRHDRGKWRTKRGCSMASELARADVRELVRLAREGERIALGEIADRFPAWLHETVADGHGDLDTEVEAALIEQLGSGHGASTRMLWPPEWRSCGTSWPRADHRLWKSFWPRRALCWLHVQLMEYEAIAYAGDLANISGSIKAREMDRRAEVVDRRLARAQSRYIQALTGLAKIRKLITPVVIGQLNVSENAVNFNSQASGQSVYELDEIN